MKLLKYKLLKEFWKKHPDAEMPLNRWAKYVESCDWRTHAELKEAFPPADYVGNDRYVFNVSGNKYRLIAVVVFFNGIMQVRFVGTHAEYDKIKNVKCI